MKKIITAIISLSFILNTSQSFAAAAEFLVQIKDHKFLPDKIEVAAGQDFKLVIENLDNTLEEFESNDLRKEKLVGAGKKIFIPIEGLKAGEYKFFGDFHQKTAQGTVIVK